MSFNWLNMVNPAAWTGPIFGKELRVSSRRGRTYWLRLAYVAGLAAFLGLMWWTEIDRRSNYYSRYSATMSEIGMMVTILLVWFQFIATQVAAVILMSASISDEIYRRTLGVLFSTPISGLQIVVGKLLAGMWQMMILILISLPVLAILRVFGGVPWEFVISAVCINLTTLLFTSAVTMFFSVFCRKAHLTIILTLFFLGIFYFLITMLVYWLLTDYLNMPWSDRTKWIVSLAHFHPLVGLYAETAFLKYPQFRLLNPQFIWQLHCLAICGMSLIFVVLSVFFVRRVGLRQIAGESGARRFKKMSSAAAAGQHCRQSWIEQKQDEERLGMAIAGSPIIWREVRAPLIGTTRKKLLFYSVIFLIVLLSYAIIMISSYVKEGSFSFNRLSRNDIQEIYIYIFLASGTLTTAVVSASKLTGEKEAGTLESLLTTPLSVARIIYGKFVGVIRECLPFWAIMYAHMLLFAAVGCISVSVPVLMAFLVFWITIFMTGLGFWFSSICRRTAGAVALNILVPLAFWLIMLFGLAMRYDDNLMRDESYIIFMPLHPLFQTDAIIIGHCGIHYRLVYTHSFAGHNHWPWGWESIGTTIGILGTCVAFYSLLGIMFLVLSALRLRRCK
ncbi:MAG: ABC transporter permease subunit [Planctomycetes bacterium]|nr:ABC transporter permease subunit [Planctomycetota bacterium]